MTRDVSTGKGVFRVAVRAGAALSPVAVLLCAAPLAGASFAAGTPCATYAVRRATGTAPSNLLRIDPGAGESTLVASLPIPVNSLGYAGSDLYAIARYPKPWLVRVHVDGTLDRIAALRPWLTPTRPRCARASGSPSAATPSTPWDNRCSGWFAGPAQHPDRAR